MRGSLASALRRMKLYVRDNRATVCDTSH
jgi:hypothetical protein